MGLCLGKNMLISIYQLICYEFIYKSIFLFLISSEVKYLGGTRDPSPLSCVSRHRFLLLSASFY